MPENLSTDDASRVDLEMVQGIWRTVAVEVDGSPVAPWLFESATLVITGDRFILRNPLPDADERTEGVLTLGAEKVPKELTVALDSGQMIEEIYEVEGNTLRICYPVKGNRRPTAFRTTPDSGLSLVLYKREKPAS